MRACLATPSYDGRLGIRYTMALVSQLAYGGGIEWTLHFASGCSLLPLARGEVVSDFLARPEWGDVLVMLDSDMAWRAEELARMVQSGLPLVGAAGRSRHDGSYCFRFLPGEDAISAKRDEAGRVAVSGIGGACLAVRRETLEQMARSYPEVAGTWRRGGPKIAGLFLPFVENGELLGEDFAFCARWRALGGTVWLDPSVWLSHDAAADPIEGCAAGMFE